MAVGKAAGSRINDSVVEFSDIPAKIVEGREVELTRADVVEERMVGAKAEERAGHMHSNRHTWEENSMHGFEHCGYGDRNGCEAYAILGIMARDTAAARTVRRYLRTSMTQRNCSWN